MTSPSFSPQPVPTGGIVRIATFTAKPGRMDDMIAAAKVNGATAMEQPGCLSAEVATVPGDDSQAVVVSRWATEADLQKYLDWHQNQAHESMADTSEGSDATAGKPVAVHHLVV